MLMILMVMRKKHAKTVAVLAQFIANHADRLMEIDEKLHREATERLWNREDHRYSHPLSLSHTHSCSLSQRVFPVQPSLRELRLPKAEGGNG